MPTQLQFRRGTTAQNNSFTGAVGEISIDTDTENIRIHDGSNAGGAELFPSGAIIAMGTSTLPANGGWQLCEGAAISRTTFARLFAIIGTTFGTGDGATTFNLPDLRDRLALGKGSNNSSLNAATTGASASAVVTSAATTPSFSASGSGTASIGGKDTSGNISVIGGGSVGSHTHATTIPSVTVQFIIKT